MENTRPILEDVTLTMIIRDEVINPAGGAWATLNHNLPFFEKAVILDTGSVDGTKEMLECVKERYPHIDIQHTEFKGYGAARQEVLGQVKTKYAMTLDADEIMPKKTVHKVSDELALNSVFLGFDFDIYSIDYKGRKQDTNTCPRRLYQIKSARYDPTTIVWENVRVVGRVKKIKSSNIYHFIIDHTGNQIKEVIWYNQIKENIANNISPSQSNRFMEYKTTKKSIVNQYGIDLKKSITEVLGLGINIPQTQKAYLESQIA